MTILPIRCTVLPAAAAVLALSAGAITMTTAGCTPGGAPGTPRAFTAEQLKAKFPWDLGPDQVDVSAYPAAQQENWKVVGSACTRCHTLARPLNSPIVKQADWLRYVRRMHMKADQHLLNRAQADAVVSFLAYDSSVRKVAKRAQFVKHLQKLNRRYADLETERARVLLEETAKMGKDRGYVSP